MANPFSSANNRTAPKLSFIHAEPFDLSIRQYLRPGIVIFSRLQPTLPASRRRGSTSHQ